MTEQSQFEPLYMHSAANEPIDLGKIESEFAIGDSRKTVDAQVTQVFVPKAELRFGVAAKHLRSVDFLKLFSEQTACDEILLGKCKVRCKAIRIEASTERGVTFAPATAGVVVTKPSASIVQSIIHLLNFPLFALPAKRSESANAASERCDCIELSAGGWHLVISPHERTRTLDDELKRTGGYAITHIAQLTRADGSEYSSEALDMAVHRTHAFLSFALGRWSGAFMPIGLDVGGDRVHEEWGVRHASPGQWSPSVSWFCATRAHSLEAVFPGFWSLWDDPIWGEAFSTVLWWYLNANAAGTDVGVDSKLILAQVALEQIAWTHCVRAEKMVSEEAFGRRGLSAADKIRLLLTTLSIPTAIPSVLASLRSRPGENWDDGPDAITSVRNALVHPRKKDNMSGDNYAQAWQLAMWYLDMVLLRLCEYNGDCSNRLKLDRYVGEVERVPWA